MNADSVPFPLPADLRVEFGALSHPGRVRPNNEDHYLVARFERTWKTLFTNLPDGQIPGQHVDAGHGMLVADGMGGHAAGEVASRAAIRTLVDLVLNTPDWMMSLDEQGVQVVMRRTQQRIQEITQTLGELVQANPSLHGMGTTLTLACSLGTNMVLGHVGDSRAYLYRDGCLGRLTRDHTATQALVDMGLIPEAEAAKHPMRHVLLNVIGTTGNPVRADIDHLRLAPDDRVLICSDGLSDMVTDAAISEVLGRSLSAADACRVLVDLALEAGGKDNVTVVLGHYLSWPDSEKAAGP
jgi:protein phosphatase